MFALFTSLFLLPPGSAEVQSIKPLWFTPSMLSLSMAGTNARFQAPWLAANVFIEVPVKKLFAMFLSLGIVTGARPVMVSE